MRKLMTAFCFVLMAGVSSRAVTIDFEQFSNNEYLGLGQIPGIKMTDFSVAIALHIYQWEGALAVPAHSGTKVAFEDADEFPATITFDTPVNQFSGYFNYLGVSPYTGLSLTAYSATGVVLEQVRAPYETNVDHCNCNTSVWDPNEFFQLTSTAPIYSVQIIAGDQDGHYFTMDDMSFSSFSASPEPGSLWLAVLAFGIYGSYRLVRRCLTRIS